MLSNQPLNPILRAALPGALLMLAACVCSTFPGLPSSGLRSMAAPTRAPGSAPRPTVALQGRGALPGVATQDDLVFGVIPPRDRYDLAARFKGITNATSSHTAANLPQVGDEQRFFVDNTTTDQITQIRAKLVYSGEHVAMWVQDGLDYDLADATKSAQRFDSETYPTDRANFGSELLPGIDGDPRVYILNNDRMGKEAAGYFNSPSEYPASIVPDSNEHEMFYMNWDAVRPGGDLYDSILAHEFQHMIHWNVDTNEDGWLNEGMSELAAFLNGYGVSNFVGSFMAAPDTQLNAWEADGSNAAHYGAAFLFNGYFLDRFGQDDLRKLVQNQDNGLQSYDSTLAGLNAEVTTDDLFKDWVIANLLNDTTAGGGRYGYHNMRHLPEPEIMQTIQQAPVSVSEAAHQYGAQYIQISGPGGFNLHFEGATQASYLPTQIGQGRGGAQGFVWWSARGDNSDMSLTREVDLTNARSATLDFDLWYAAEDGWDYGYVEVSPDGGKSWQIIRTDASTTSNPHGNAYGPGYTGLSSDQSGADAGGWLHQTASLGLFAGKKILLRFEMITDDAVNLQGIALDNICIKDINWCDDAESETPGWDTQGFVRINNTVRQKYTVQVVVPADDGSISVTDLPLDDANTGDLAIRVGSRPATVVIAGLTRYTTETAPYHLEVSASSR